MVFTMKFYTTIGTVGNKNTSHFKYLITFTADMVRHGKIIVAV